MKYTVYEIFNIFEFKDVFNSLGKSHPAPTMPNTFIANKITEDLEMMMDKTWWKYYFDEDNKSAKVLVKQLKKAIKDIPQDYFTITVPVNSQSWSTNCFYLLVKEKL